MQFSREVNEINLGQARDKFQDLNDKMLCIAILRFERRMGNEAKNSSIVRS